MLFPLVATVLITPALVFALNSAIPHKDCTYNPIKGGALLEGRCFKQSNTYNATYQYAGDCWLYSNDKKLEKPFPCDYQYLEKTQCPCRPNVNTDVSMLSQWGCKKDGERCAVYSHEDPNFSVARCSLPGQPRIGVVGRIYETEEELLSISSHAIKDPYGCE